MYRLLQMLPLPRLAKAVAEELAVAGRLDDGARAVRDAAARTGAEAGDGTATAAVLAWAIYRERTRLVAEGHEPPDIDAGLWQVPSLGLHDSFLDLGGNSLLATEVARRAARVGLTMEPRDLLRHPTEVDAILELITRHLREREVPLTGDAPLAFLHDAAAIAAHNALSPGASEAIRP